MTVTARARVTTVRYRKMILVRSVLLALADRQMHGPVRRAGIMYLAKRENRCDDCGLPVKIGDRADYAERPGLQPTLFVHAECPGDDILFREIRWLNGWRGADIVSAWIKTNTDQMCTDCKRMIRIGAVAALVRRPGPMVRGKKHSDWKCERCVKV